MIIVNQSNVVRSGTRSSDFSHHDFVRALLRISKPRRKPLIVRARSLDRLDLSAFHTDLQYTDWEGLFSAQDVAGQWSAFTRTLQPVLDRHASMRTIAIRNPTVQRVTDTTRDIMGHRRYVLGQQGRHFAEYR